MNIKTWEVVDPRKSDGGRAVRLKHVRSRIRAEQLEP